MIANKMGKHSEQGRRVERQRAWGACGMSVAASVNGAQRRPLGMRRRPAGWSIAKARWAKPARVRVRRARAPGGCAPGQVLVLGRVRTGSRCSPSQEPATRARRFPRPTAGARAA